PGARALGDDSRPETGTPRATSAQPPQRRIGARGAIVRDLDSYGAIPLGVKVVRFAGGPEEEAPPACGPRAGVHAPVECGDRGKRECRTRSGSPWRAQRLIRRKRVYARLQRATVD